MGFSLLSYDPDADFRNVKEVAAKLIERVLKEGLPIGVCLNVNVPDLPPGELEGIRICSQANGYWKEEFQKRTDPHGKDYYWLTGFFQNREPDGKGEGTDEWALERKFASVVPVNTDFTARHLLRGLKHWEEG